jgi:hypothetical protein
MPYGRRRAQRRCLRRRRTAGAARAAAGPPPGVSDCLCRLPPGRGHARRRGPASGGCPTAYADCPPGGGTGRGTRAAAGPPPGAVRLPVPPAPVRGQGKDPPQLVHHHRRTPRPVNRGSRSPSRLQQASTPPRAGPPGIEATAPHSDAPGRTSVVARAAIGRLAPGSRSPPGRWLRPTPQRITVPPATGRARAQHHDRDGDSGAGPPPVIKVLLTTSVAQRLHLDRHCGRAPATGAVGIGVLGG